MEKFQQKESLTSTYLFTELVAWWLAQSDVGQVDLLDVKGGWCLDWKELEGELVSLGLDETLKVLDDLVGLLAQRLSVPRWAVLDFF